ncbi:MAG: hypothetical protein R2692_07340 [Microbacterium sp.]
MTAESMYAAGEWFTVAGLGYEKSGEIRRAAALRTLTSRHSPSR